MTQSSVTNSRLCNYGCNTLIYWNNSKRAFVEVEIGNKHFCQARKPTNTMGSNNLKVNSPTFTTGSGKPLLKHSNSIQVLKGSEEQVTKQYEKLSDIVTELGGKIHGSQSHYVNASGIGSGNFPDAIGVELRIIAYYEVPTSENRKLVKQKITVI